MHYRRFLVLILIVALLIAAAASEPVHGGIKNILDWAKPIIRYHDVLGLIVFFLLSTLSAIFVFFSGAIIVPIAVYAWGKPITILLLWASWFLGGLITYSFGRHPGRRLAKWIISSKKVSKYEKKFSEGASFPLVLLFQLAVPSEIPGYALGTLRYPLGKFLGAIAIAELPFAIGTVYLSDSFIRQQYILLIGIGVCGVCLMAIAFYFFHKRLEKK